MLVLETRTLSAEWPWPDYGGTGDGGGGDLASSCKIRQETCIGYLDLGFRLWLYFSVDVGGGIR